MRSPLVLAATMVAFAVSPAAGQCVARVDLPSLHAGTGGVLCVSIVPIGVVAPPGGFEPACGARVVIKPDDPDHGHWGFLDLGGCTVGPCGGSGGGSNQLECQLAYGAACWIPIGTQLTLMPGQRPGALRDAMQARFASDTDRRQGLCFQQYVGNGRRIIVVPLTAALADGHRQVELTGLAAFFLIALPAGGGDSVEAEYLPVVFGR